MSAADIELELMKIRGEEIGVDFPKNISFAQDEEKIIEIMTAKEYMDGFCGDMIKDLEMIGLKYDINKKHFIRVFLSHAYIRMLKNPRLRIDYRRGEIELYNLKKYQAVTIIGLKI